VTTFTTQSIRASVVCLTPVPTKEAKTMAASTGKQDRRRWNPWMSMCPQPQYDIRLLLVPDGKLKGFETEKQAEAEKKSRVRSLSESKLLGAQQLAIRLSNCNNEDRCNSNACPVCARQARVWFCGAILALFNQTLTSELQVITLMKDAWSYKAGFLNKLTPRDLTSQIRRHFDRSELGHVLMLGAIHGEFNEGNQVWTPHVHAICHIGEGCNLNILRKKYYSSTGSICKPMMVQRFTNRPRQTAYLLKSFWGLRISTPKPAKGHNDSTKRIGEPHHTEYLLWLDSWKLSDLLLFYNGKRNGDALRRR